jgi:hypothetical protein
MLPVYLLDKDRSSKAEEKDIADLPWLTDSPLVQIQQEPLFLRQQRADGSKKLLWFRTDVLDGYKNHRYCDVDVINPFSCVLIFLDNDKKPFVTSTLFEIHNCNIIMIGLQDFLAVPPKERNHWQKYQIMDNLDFYR